MKSNEERGTNYVTFLNYYITQGMHSYLTLIFNSTNN
jgi:hypothetical protein